MTRSLPEVNSLTAAVQRVISQNRAVHYHPNRFASKTRSGNLPNEELIRYLTDLINTRRAEPNVGTFVERIKEVLTIEDYLQYEDLATRWGFDPGVTQAAQEAVRYYDKLAEFQRWERKESPSIF